MASNELSHLRVASEPGQRRDPTTGVRRPHIDQLGVERDESSKVAGTTLEHMNVLDVGYVVEEALDPCPVNRAFANREGVGNSVDEQKPTVSTEDCDVLGAEPRRRGGSNAAPFEVANAYAQSGELELPARREREPPRSTAW